MTFCNALRTAYDAGMGVSLKGEALDVVYFLSPDARGQFIVRSVSPRSRGKGEWRDAGPPCLLKALEGEYEMVPLPWAPKPQSGPSLSDLL